jgi:hypothetical protein
MKFSNVVLISGGWLTFDSRVSGAKSCYRAWFQEISQNRRFRVVTCFLDLVNRLRVMSPYEFCSRQRDFPESLEDQTGFLLIIVDQATCASKPRHKLEFSRSQLLLNTHQVFGVKAKHHQACILLSLMQVPDCHCFGANLLAFDILPVYTRTRCKYHPLAQWIFSTSDGVTADHVNISYYIRLDKSMRSGATRTCT